jgi:hypothetical protein
VPSTTTFTGADAGNPHAWTDNANWTAGVPTASSDVIIGAGGLVNLGLNSTINSLTVNGTLNVSGSNLTLNAVGTVSSLGTLNLTGAAHLTAPGGFNNAGALSIGASSSLTVGNSPLPGGLLGWWTGDGNPSDSAGPHGGTNNGATFAASKVNQAFSFDGMDDSVDVGNFSLPETFTLASWINLAGTGNQAILAKDAGGMGMPNSYYFAVEPAGTLVASVRNGSGDLTLYRTSMAVVSPGSWHHVALSYNGGAPASERMVFYVDGASISASVVADAGGAPETDAQDAMIGSLNGSAWPFNGQIDELRAYDHVLAQADVQADMGARPFSQTSGNTALQQGTLTANGGVNIEAGSLAGSGTLFGSLFNSGQLFGSGTAGTINVNGDFTQTPTGVLNEEIGGTSPGTGGYDQLNVGGKANLGGAFNVSLINGFFPPATQQLYQVLTFDPRNGDFASKSGLAPNFSYLYDAFSLNLQSPANPIAPTTLPNWTVNQPGYNQTITASGGTGTFTFAQAGGTLPSGLTLSSSGVLSGTPTAMGTYNFSVSATDGMGTTSIQPYTVVINPAVTITTTTLPDWTRNGPSYNQTILATGGTGALTFSLTGGALPPGVALSSGMGTLTGVPTTVGSYTFTLTATDGVGASASRMYTVTINSPVMITTTSAANADLNTAYSQTFQATGGTGSLMFSKSAGTLPPGLTLSSGGVLSGTPAAPGTYNFSVTATDSVGATNTQTYTVIVRISSTFAVAAFKGNGLWRHSDSGGWQQLTPADATQSAVDDRGNVAAIFSNGLWRYQDASGWQRLTPAIPSLVDIAGNAIVVANFPGNGLWRYGVPAIAGGGWLQLTVTDVRSIGVDDVGDTVFALPGSGTFLYQDASGWQQLSPAVALQVSIAASGNSVAALFQGGGVWRYNLQPLGVAPVGWQQLTPAQASSLAIGATGAVVCAFSNGVWLYQDSGGWVNLTPAVPSLVGITNAAQVVAEFPGNGVWEYTSSGWMQLTPADAKWLRGAGG